MARRRDASPTGHGVRQVRELAKSVGDRGVGLTRDWPSAERPPPDCVARDPPLDLIDPPTLSRAVFTLLDYVPLMSTCDNLLRFTTYRNLARNSNSHFPTISLILFLIIVVF